MAAEAAGQGKRKGGGMSAIISLMLVSIIAAGAGTAFDMFLLAPAEAPKQEQPAAEEAHAAPADSHGDKSGHDEQGKGGASSDAKIDLGNYLMTLPPIKGNLAPPAAAWARLELVVSFKGGAPAESEKLAAVLSEDVVSYLRTVPISQFDSSTGLEYLRDDLEDLARIRTDGKASAVIVKSLILE